MILWLPVFLLYCYPLMYVIVPRYLFSGKYVQFAIMICFWGLVGFFVNYLFRTYVFIPVQLALGFQGVVRSGWQPGSFLLLTTTAAGTTMIVIFNNWVRKEQQLLRTEKEKVTTELQLLKAQIHPHFLFNTLNNIYSFSLENSPKTPQLILKLSSLLSYMLYDCKAEEVVLEREIQIMKNYIDLERERYGNKIEISWSVSGDINNKGIAPLLLLPFLENAFKHGTSDQLEKPWLSIDLTVELNILKCKIVNSKNEAVATSNNGIGLQNVRKRLELIYPGKHEVKLHDEGNFYVVSLMLILNHRMGKADNQERIILSGTEKVSL
jgi:two-component system sensor histidine kinase AlgZ